MSVSLFHRCFLSSVILLCVLTCLFARSFGLPPLGRSASSNQISTDCNSTPSLCRNMRRLLVLPDSPEEKPTVNVAVPGNISACLPLIPTPNSDLYHILFLP